jgi:hypothetical protein
MEECAVMINDQTRSEVTIDQVLPPTWANDVLAKATGQAELLILPRGMRDGRGEYRSIDLSVVKMLRAGGVDAAWAHQGPERTFGAEYGVKEDALAISLFVTRALGEASVVEVARWLLGRVRQMLGGRPSSEGGPPVVVEVARLTMQGDRTDFEWLRVTGKDERIVEAVRPLLRGDPPPQQ